MNSKSKFMSLLKSFNLKTLSESLKIGKSALIFKISNDFPSFSENIGYYFLESCLH